MNTSYKYLDANMTRCMQALDAAEGDGGFNISYAPKSHMKQVGLGHASRQFAPIGRNKDMNVGSANDQRANSDVNVSAASSGQ
mmetsp:Transcript_883/g.1312  ORF Transcript_883/g.1312 Transcript_883/m.1312 type:complete len:83 (-) Transcript_883:1-249(-)